MKKGYFFLIIIILIFSGCDSNSTSSNKAPEPPYAPTPSHNAHDVGNVATLRWTCYDAEDDNLTYNIYMGKNELSKIASGLTTNSYTTEPLDYSTEYSWKVEADDGHSTTKGPKWNFRTVAEDIAPTEPGSPEPVDNTTDVGVDQILRWYCYDINGDTVNFDIRLGTSEEPPCIASDIAEYQFEVENLEYHTMYYWQIVARSTDKITEGPVWCFETKYYNYPPDKPFDPVPADNSTDISIHVNLMWSCDDQENDPLNYDVYFGTDNNPPLFEQGIIYTSYQPGNLEPNTDYYWRIDAWDGTNYSHGPAWHFQTGNPNNAPIVPHSPWPSDGATGESTEAWLRWTCIDPDGDALSYKVYFGTVPNLSENNVIATGINEENWSLSTLQYNTVYYWKIKATDGEIFVFSPTWSFTTESFTP